MTALLTADEAASLGVGVNVIVRPGWQPFAIGDVQPEIIAPQDWVALTGPCPTCGGSSKVYKDWIALDTVPGYDPRIPCPDCRDGRDGRRIVPLYTECPHCLNDPPCEHKIESGSHGWGCDKCGLSGVGPLLWHRGFKCENRLVLVGRGSIEVVPVLELRTPLDPDPAVNRWLAVSGGTWLCWQHHDGYTVTTEPSLNIDPLPVPGRDFGIVIDVTELAQ